jgi:hypothetical protein
MSREQMKNGSDLSDQELPAELQSLFASYRNALPDPEPGPDFMPQLWAKIEIRQNTAYSFGRIARGFVTAALALCLLMTLISVSPLGSKRFVISSTYLDVLSEDHSDDVAEAELLHVDNL